MELSGTGRNCVAGFGKLSSRFCAYHRVTTPPVRLACVLSLQRRDNCGALSLHGHPGQAHRRARTRRSPDRSAPSRQCRLRRVRCHKLLLPTHPPHLLPSSQGYSSWIAGHTCASPVGELSFVFASWIFIPTVTPRLVGNLPGYVLKSQFPRCACRQSPQFAPTIRAHP